MSFFPAPTSQLKVRQTLRYRYLRRIRHIAEGLCAFDLGLWRRFDQPSIQAVARDFRVIGNELRHQMEFFRVANPVLQLPCPVGVPQISERLPEQLELKLPRASSDRRDEERVAGSDRRAHAR